MPSEARSEFACPLMLTKRAGSRERRKALPNIGLQQHAKPRSRREGLEAGFECQHIPSSPLFPVGLLVATPLVERFGVRPLIFVGGCYLLLTGLFALIPSIKRLEADLAQRKA